MNKSDNDYTHSGTNSPPEFDNHLLGKPNLTEKEKRFYETIINTNPDLIYVFDLNYRFTYANKALLEMWGLTWQQSIGKTLIENGYEPWHAEMHEREIDEVVKTKKPIRGEVSFPHATLGVRIYDYIFAPVLNENNEVEAIAGSTRDITELKLSENTLQQKTAELLELTNSLEQKVKERTLSLEAANQNLESLNFIASHDLQEPLRKIRTFIALLQDKQMNSESSRLYLEKIDAAAIRMSTLIKAVLDYGKLSKHEKEFSNTDLNAIVYHVKEDFELMIAEKQAIIKTEELPTINADALQMNQLFTNLLSNALKFSQNKPLINISFKHAAGSDVPNMTSSGINKSYIHLIFSDNGIGFEPQFKDHIFQLFQRLNSNKEYPGTGIGLSIVKKIVENHKGYITADSQPGVGTTFNIWLPV